MLSPPQAVKVPSLLDYMAYHSLKEVEGGWTWKFHTSVFQSDFGVRERMFQQGDLIAATPGRKAILYGQESVLFDDDSAAYLRECGAIDVPIIGIPGAAHHLMLDEPIAFVSVLRSILAQWSVEERP